MRWIKHPCNFSRSAAMSEIRERFGSAGYGAVWLMLERIAEDFAVSGQKTEPDLCLSEKDWRVSSGLSAKKLQNLLEVLQSHGVIFAENREKRIRLTSPILAQLQDEWTKRTRKNSGVAQEPPPNSLSPEQTTEEKRKDEKDNRTEVNPGIPEALRLVLKRHGLLSDHERARRISRYMERKQLDNPGGYLEKILQGNPNFDPDAGEEKQQETPSQTDRQQGPRAIGEILREMGLPGSAREEQEQ
jgi:hypothetical protein